jgi:hypothetical protein
MAGSHQGSRRLGRHDEAPHGFVAIVGLDQNFDLSPRF